MRTEELERLLEAYRSAPAEFHATSYWQAYEKKIREEIEGADLSLIRSGKYPTLATFGFGDVVNYYHPSPGL